MYYVTYTYIYIDITWGYLMSCIPENGWYHDVQPMVSHVDIIKVVPPAGWGEKMPAFTRIYGGIMGRLSGVNGFDKTNLRGDLAVQVLHTNAFVNMYTVYVHKSKVDFYLNAMLKSQSFVTDVLSMQRTNLFPIQPVSNQRNTRTLYNAVPFAEKHMFLLINLCSHPYTYMYTDRHTKIRTSQNKTQQNRTKHNVS